MNISKIISLRHFVQLTVCIILLFAGWHFHQFVDYVRGEGLEVSRPPIAESFLPIAGIIAFKVLMFTGLFDTIHPAGLTILLAAILTAFLFRRALCSWVCPIGALSEQLGRLGKRVLGKNVRVPKWLDISLLSVKYVMFTAIFWIFASMSGQDAISFIQAPFYSVSDIKLFDMFANLSVPGFLVIGFFTMMSIPIKSFWCRYLCPYGAFLGVIGLISPVILKKDDKACIHCGACSKACLNRVNIEGKKSAVVTAECIGCTSCVSACPKKGTLQFKLLGILPISPRIFSVAFLVTFFTIIIIAQLTGHWETSLTLDNYRSFDRLLLTGTGG